MWIPHSWWLYWACFSFCAHSMVPVQVFISSSNCFLMHLLLPNPGLFIALRLFPYKYSSNVVIPLFKSLTANSSLWHSGPYMMIPMFLIVYYHQPVFYIINSGATKHQHSPELVLQFLSQCLYSCNIFFLKQSIQTLLIKTGSKFQG